MAPDGALYVGGIRDSGWGGANNIGEVVKMQIGANGVPCGIAEVRAAPNGFMIRFTKDVDPVLAGRPDSYSVSSYTRVSTPAYGGQDRNRRNDSVLAATVSSNARQVTLTLKELRTGYVYELHLKNLAPANQPFYPADAYYTVRGGADSN